MAFIPTNKIVCDTIRIKIAGDSVSDFITIPFKSDYEKFSSIIVDTCERLNLPLEAIQFSGGGLVTDPEKILDEKGVVNKLQDKAHLRLQQLLNNDALHKRSSR